MTSRKFLFELFLPGEDAEVDHRDEDVDAARKSADDGPLPSTAPLYKGSSGI